MRIGEILLQERVITGDHLLAARRLHDRYGGRFGSALVRLGYVDPDTLSRALGQKHGVPAVMKRHLEKIDPAAVALLSSRLAEHYMAIPLGFTARSPRRLIVAFRDPSILAEGEVSFAAGCPVEAAILPEVVLVQLLERYYGIKRGPEMPHAYAALSFISEDPLPPPRIPGAGRLTQTPPPPATTRPTQMPPPPATPRPTQMPPPPATTRPAPMPPPAPSRPTQMPPSTGPRAPMAPSTAPRASTPTPPPVARSTQTPTPPPIPRSTPMPPSVAPRSPTPAPRAYPPPPSLPTIAPPPELFTAGAAPSPPQRRASLPPPPRLPVIPDLGAPPSVPVPSSTSYELPSRPAIDLPDALLRISTAETSGEVGDAIVDYLRSAFGAGLVFGVQGGVARGLKGFSVNTNDLFVEAITILLSSPSVFTVACERQAPFRGRPPESGVDQNERLWHVLRSRPPTEVVVAPVLIDARVTHLMYAHAFDSGLLPIRAAVDMTRLASAAAEAYARILDEA